MSYLISPNPSSPTVHDELSHQPQSLVPDVHDEVRPPRPPPYTLASADMYSLDRFRQAWLAIASRDFTNTLQAASPTPLDDGHPFPATFLVPIVDLMNHGGGASNVDVRFDRRRGGFVLTATKSIRRGEELRFSYGKLCAEQALLTYGFADDDMVACPPPGRQ